MAVPEVDNSPTNRPRPGRLSAHDKIDICRGLFAFMVVIAHGLEMTWTMTPRVPGQLPPLIHRLIAYGAGTGIYWVMGFFVISGYCIYLSAQRLIEEDSFQLKSYMIARLTRILPLYFVALLFTALVEWWVAGDRPPIWPNGVSPRVFLCQLLLLQNFTDTYGAYAPSWSITNEVFYYVFYGLIVFAVVRLCKWPALVGMAMCVAIGLFTQALYRIGYRSNPLLQFGLLFGLGINWFFGALVAEHREWLVQNREVRTVARCWPLGLLLAIGMWCSQRVHLEFVFLTAGMAFTLMLIHFLAVESQAGAPRVALSGSQKLFVAMSGLSSYPTYLFHGPVLVLTGWVILHWKLELDWRVIWALSASIAIACGVALGYGVERPIMAWRAALLKSLRSSGRSAVSGRVSRPIWGNPAVRT